MTPDCTAYILLEDGARFDGIACGADRPAVGEIVFTTSMSGYQEAMTDPSYAGQLIAFTYPQIGNYGVSPEAMESDRVSSRPPTADSGADRLGAFFCGAVRNLRRGTVHMLSAGALVDTGEVTIGCVIADGTETGVRATVMPGRRIVETPIVAANALVMTNC